MCTVSAAAAVRSGSAAHSPRRSSTEDGRAAHMKGFDGIDGGPGDGLACCHLFIDSRSRMAGPRAQVGEKAAG